MKRILKLPIEVDGELFLTVEIIRGEEALYGKVTTGGGEVYEFSKWE